MKRSGKTGKGMQKKSEEKWERKNRKRENNKKKNDSPARLYFVPHTL